MRGRAGKTTKKALGGTRDKRTAQNSCVKVLHTEREWRARTARERIDQRKRKNGLDFNYQEKAVGRGKDKCGSRPPVNRSTKK